MSKARVIITAVVVEKRSKAEVARAYGVSRQWVSELVKRYLEEGDTAFESRSKAPLSKPGKTGQAVSDRIVALRGELASQGLDAGPVTIREHLIRQGFSPPAVSTIHRILVAAGVVQPQPHKRPKSSWIRFEADQPNECWQSDFTHYRLADGTDTEILNFLDDHSRYLLACKAFHRVNATCVAQTFIETTTTFGVPASTLTDNGMVYTVRLAGHGRQGGQTRFERLLSVLGVEQKNGKPNHPQTQGKVERFHQTLKKWLTAQTPQPITLTQLQTLLDVFTSYYNTQRPHRSLQGKTPTQAYQARTKAEPKTTDSNQHWRVRTDKIDTTGAVTIRHASRLHHIGVGRKWTGTPITMLIRNLEIRIINLNTGEILRSLTLDPTKDYQPQNQRQQSPETPT
jgi:transposase InsO family protein